MTYDTAMTKTEAVPNATTLNNRRILIDVTANLIVPTGLSMARILHDFLTKEV
jgi:hypothetical protein